MPKQLKFKHCKKCGKELTDNYCSNCGCSQELIRIDRQYILNEISSVLYLDKGILYTIRELFIRPGKIIKEFIFEDRNRLVKPIVFIIICSLIFSVLELLLDFDFGYLKGEADDSPTVTIIFDWLNSNLGLANILMIFFMAFWIKIFFRKSDYNFYEILILLCYVNGVVMLIHSVIIILFILNLLTPPTYLTVISVLYCSWAIGQFFSGKKYINYIKAFLSYIFGMLSFVIASLGIGILIDFIIKNSN